MPQLTDPQSIFSKAKAIAKPSFLLGLGSFVVGTMVIGHSLDHWIRTELPGKLEKNLSTLIQRPIKISNIQQYSLTQLTLGPCFIPPTANHSSQLQVRSLIVSFDPWQILHQGKFKTMITLEGAQGILPSNPEKEWTNFAVNSTQLPLPLDVIFKTEKALVKIKNQKVIAVTGQLRYLQSPEVHWQYQAKLEGQDLNLNLEGETFNQDLQSQLSLDIQKLSLADVQAILPSKTLKITEKNIFNHLGLFVVNQQALEKNLGVNSDNLGDLTLGNSSLNKSLKIDLNVRVNRQKLVFEKGQLSWGTLTAKLEGNYDWHQGFNLDSEVKIRNLTEWGTLLGIDSAFVPEKSGGVLPLNSLKKKREEMGGSLVAKFKLRGTWEKPWLLGSLRNQQSLEFQGIQVKKLEVDFNSDFNRFNLPLLNVEMGNGDRLLSRGYWDGQFLNQIKSSHGFKPWQKSKLQLTVKGKMSPQYYLSQLITVNHKFSIQPLIIQGTVNGALENLDGNIQWKSLALNQNLTQGNLTLSGNIGFKSQKISLNSQILQDKKGYILSQGIVDLSRSQWQINNKISNLILKPYLSSICDDIRLACDFNPQVSTGQLGGSGTFRGLLPQINQAQTAITLNIKLGQEQTEFFSSAKLQEEQIKAQILWNSLPRSLVSINLPQQWQVKQGIIQANLPITDIQSAIQLGINVNPQALNLSLLTKLQLGEAAGQIRGDMRSGKLQVRGLIPQKFTVPKSFLNVPLPVALKQTAFQFNYLFKDQSLDLTTRKSSENISNLALKLGLTRSSAAANSNFLQPLIDQLLANLTGNIKTQVILGQNKFVTVVNLKQQNLTALLTNPHLSIQDFLNLDSQGRKINQSLIAIAPYVYPSPNKPQLNLILAGNLKTILNSEKIIPIEAKSLWLKGDNYGLLARGQLNLTKSLLKPDLELANLSLLANSNRLTLRLNSLLDNLDVERSLLPQNLQGQAQINFRGQFRGQKLLTQPWQNHNLQLTGQLKLNQLQINHSAFEPQLTGQLAIASGDFLKLNLRGKQDQFSTVWRANGQNLGLLGYTPESLLIKQQTGQSIPIVLKGKASGNQFLTTLESFPLDLLELAWLSNFGIHNYLEARVRGNFAWDWQQQQARGNLILSPPDRFWWDQQPAHLTTDFIYNNNLIQLSQTNLYLDQNYSISDASLNLRSGVLTGQLDIPDGRIDGIVKALPHWLPQANKPIELNNLSNINPNSATISSQLNALWKVDNQVRKVLENAQNSLPKTLDLQGKFAAKVTLGGNLRSPQVDFQLQGKRWIWYTQPPQPSLLAPLGFVMTMDQVIPIENLLFQGNLSPQAFNLKTQLDTTGSDLQGHLALRTSEKGLYLEPSELKVQNLSLDTLKNWAKIPWDVSGQVNLDINLSGIVTQPQLKGDFNFENLAWNGQLLHQDISGKLEYKNQTFSLQTIKPDAIQLLADVSLPNETSPVFPFNIKVNLKTEALALINNFTSDRFNVEWNKGEGELRLKTGGTISLGNPLSLTLDPNSELQLSLAKVSFKTPLLSQLLDFNGQITLKNNYFIFNNFTSQVGPQTVISRGQLPLFPPSPNEVNPNNPLTLTFRQNEEGSDRLYQGELDGQIQITGSALSPIVEGKISLKNGVLSVPDRLPEKKSPPAVSLQWFGQKENTLKNLFIKPPQLKNFQLSLDNLELNQRQKRPFFIFNVTGNLTLDGFLDSPYSLEPKGSIQVNSGSVNFAPSSVFIDENEVNEISFFPKQGLLNPTVNLNLQLYLLNLSLITLKNNAIPDDLIQSQRAQSFLLHIGIRGQAGQLLPQLNPFQSDRCLLFTENQAPFPVRPTFPSPDLNQYGNCLNSRSVTIETLEDLVSSPLVSITSSPPLTRGQALALFVNQYAEFSDRFIEQNEQQFMQAGYSQVAATIAPGIQDLIFNANMQSINWGNAIGLDTLQVYPTLSTQYRLDHDAVIRMDYDYSLNQGRIQYQRQF